MTCDDDESAIIAYVCGGSLGPDFAAVAAMGCRGVVLDSSAVWYRDSMLAEANAHGLIATAIFMGAQRASA